MRQFVLGERRRIPLACVLFILGALFYANPLRAQAQDAGAVLSLRGDWRVRGQQRALSEGQAVPAGATIQCPSPRADDAIVIVLLNVSRLELRCGDRPDVCRQGLHVPDTAAGATSQSTRLIKAVAAALLGHGPEVARSLSSTISRGEGTSQLREAVVPYTSGGSIPIGPYLRDFSPNAQIDGLRVRNFNDGEIISSSPIDPRDRNGVVVKLPRPGPFVAEALLDNDEVALNLLIVAVPPASVDKLKADFDHGRELCASWEKDGAASSEHMLLRAYLLSLAKGL